MDSCLRHLRFADYSQSRWKNGRGVTREIAVARSRDSEPPAWRISMATISEPAEFSSFPGVDRSLAVVDGGGIDLTVDRVSRVLGVGDDPARFSGDSETSARPIAGATLDLNLMVDPLRAVGTVTVACAGEHETAEGRWFVMALTDGLEVRIAGDRLVVDRLDTATFEVGDGQHCWVSLVPDRDTPDRDTPDRDTPDGATRDNDTHASESRVGNTADGNTADGKAPDGRVVAYLIRVSA
ncbi:HutD family protein [Homoserinimonas sp. OAct 916]|uniref:HutD/Ves family protein n=1 Tax=Homoserinimonas sp. OAct 916 TaxID=2211450 RepID=UPI0013001D7E|nr:HutD family protein [Homoserinimonas sp. OAct 916]